MFKRQQQIIDAMSQVTPLPLCIIAIITEDTVYSEVALWKQIKKLGDATECILKGISLHYEFMDGEEALEDEMGFAKFYNKEMKKWWIHYKGAPLSDLWKLGEYWERTEWIRKSIIEWIPNIKSDIFFDYNSKNIEIFISTVEPEL